MADVKTYSYAKSRQVPALHNYAEVAYIEEEVQSYGCKSDLEIPEGQFISDEFTGALKEDSVITVWIKNLSNVTGNLGSTGTIFCAGANVTKGTQTGFQPMFRLGLVAKAGSTNIKLFAQFGYEDTAFAQAIKTEVELTNEELKAEHIKITLDKSGVKIETPDTVSRTELFGKTMQPFTTANCTFMSGALAYKSFDEAGIKYTAYLRNCDITLMTAKCGIGFIKFIPCRRTEYKDKTKKPEEITGKYLGFRVNIAGGSGNNFLYTNYAKSGSPVPATLTGTGKDSVQAVLRNTTAGTTPVTTDYLAVKEYEKADRA